MYFKYINILIRSHHFHDQDKSSQLICYNQLNRRNTQFDQTLEHIFMSLQEIFRFKYHFGPQPLTFVLN
jgi:hypothetical protein